MPREEQERRRHIRQWARLMIVHLERSDFDANHYSYVETLERLRELVDRELQQVQGVAMRSRTEEAW